MTLEELRQKIDEADERLIDDLRARFALTDAVGEWKRENGVAVRDISREEAVLARARALAGDAYGEEIAAVYRTLFALARGREEQP